MPINYILIDDETSARSFVAPINASTDELDIQQLHLREADEIIDAISTRKPDGLLIDLELTRSIGKAASLFKFEGTTLAQELRTKSNINPALSIPMVSFSYKTRRNLLIGPDTTAVDLFDWQLAKTEASKQASRTAIVLVDLSLGYKTIYPLVDLAVQHRQNLLGLSRENHEHLDPRIDAEIAALVGRSVHDIARFFLHTLLPFSGPLISEELLATRLGIDREASGAAWRRLLQVLPREVQYHGVFSNVYARWWMFLLEEWWNSSMNMGVSMKMLDATERVEILRRRLQLDALCSIVKPRHGRPSRYWAVCARSGAPVDPSGGYAILDHQRMKAWHDQRYVSRSAALRNIHKLHFLPGEKDRLRPST